MLCWGVYRYRDAQYGMTKVANPSNKRYVICNPSADFRLMPTDLVYVLQQFNPNQNKKNTKPANNNDSTKSNRDSGKRDSCGEKTARSNCQDGQSAVDPLPAKAKETSFKQLSRSSTLSRNNKRTVSRSGSSKKFFTRKLQQSSTNEQVFQSSELPNLTEKIRNEFSQPLSDSNNRDDYYLLNKFPTNSFNNIETAKIVSNNSNNVNYTTFLETSNLDNSGVNIKKKNAIAKFNLKKSYSNIINQVSNESTL
jgi:hypothetical protein